MYYQLVDKIWHLVALVRIVFHNIVSGGRIKISLSVMFRRRFEISVWSGGRISIGKRVFFNQGCSVVSRGASITIGDGTVFGENVKIYDHNHQYKNVSRPVEEQGYTSAAVRIGKSCWIGSNVAILKGVTVGDHSVIGAGCIIHKDVPPNTVVVNRQELVMRHFA